ncbi:ABC transporter substrate-binding protein [Paenibacillus hodogayensis]|uniref:ABC transporter substrate-binding protein n=1 Tax=Paenibacillus hodogayensis TaxID=279208 RepID=A0ABV5VR22_9BACL
MNKKKTVFWISMTMAVVVLAGCSKTSGGEGEKAGAGVSAISTQPVTLTAAIDGINVDDRLRELIIQQLQQKHPNITLQIFSPVKGTTLNELIVAGETPDIIFTFNGNLLSYRDRDLLYDMSPMLKTHNVDLNKFDAGIIRDIRIASAKDEIYALPFSLNFHALYYNKDLFDKFGVPYPQDGMNWDQTLDLAKRVTRNEGGTQYRGLDTGNGVLWIAQPLSAAAVDPLTEKASVNTEDWKKVFNLVKSIYSIPGNDRKADAFLKDKTLAMQLQLNMLISLEKATSEGLNWDIAQYPSYPERPNTYGNASVQALAVTKSSKYKEQAMQVISMVTSDEFQLASSKKGWMPAVKNPDIQKAFGTDVPYLNGKKLASIFKSKPVPYPVSSQYRAKAESILQNQFTQFLNNASDVNTALAKAEEEINKMIAENGK